MAFHGLQWRCLSRIGFELSVIALVSALPHRAAARTTKQPRGAPISGDRHMPPPDHLPR